MKALEGTNLAETSVVEPRSFNRTLGWLDTIDSVRFMGSDVLRLIAEFTLNSGTQTGSLPISSWFYSAVDDNGDLYFLDNISLFLEVTKQSRSLRLLESDLHPQVRCTSRRVPMVLFVACRRRVSVRSRAL